ncbi:MAG TPA: hypothetical protein VEK75_04335 [Xanthobacteraceae bacterium]|nr:hypothetical protein [Xanthobacteraceae bacterium]
MGQRSHCSKPVVWHLGTNDLRQLTPRRHVPGRARLGMAAMIVLVFVATPTPAIALIHNHAPRLGWIQRRGFLAAVRRAFIATLCRLGDSGEIRDTADAPMRERYRRRSNALSGA